MISLPSYVKDFMKLFQDANYQIYVVGGAVRDLLSRKNPPIGGENWDFATDATPQEILELFPDGFYNNQFGTVGISQKIDDSSLLFEVTTFRKEGEYKDMRHPQRIEWAKTIREDLARRDFTINAIALRLVSLAQGRPYEIEIIDLHKGQEDLKNKLIRTVGEADRRFREDALRLMRAVRFSSELGFMIEEKTRASIQKNALLITNISWERIRDEFLKILASDYPSEGVVFLKNTDLLAHILPEVDVCFTIPQKSPKRHHIYDVGTHLLMSLKHCPSKDPITRFATLIHDIGKAQTFRRNDETGLITFYNHEVVGTKLAAQIADRLHLSNQEKDKLVRLVQFHQFTVNELQTDKAIRRFIRNITPDYLDDMIALRYGDRVGSGAKPTSWRFELFKKRLVEVQKQPFKVTDLAVNGNDVMEILKLKPGPKVGEILKSIFNDVEEGRVKNQRELLLDKIKTVVASP